MQMCGSIPSIVEEMKREVGFTNANSGHSDAVLAAVPVKGSTNCTSPEP